MQFTPKTNTIVFMGPIGSGKGTQAKLLAERTGFTHFSSGEWYRARKQEDDLIGRRIAQSIDSGDLIPEWFHNYVIQNLLIQLPTDQGIILDSVAKKPGEAPMLNTILTWLERDYVVILFDIPEAEIHRRLAVRYVEEHRPDDAPDKIQVRLERYAEETMQSIEYFRSLGKVLAVNGAQTPDAVHAEILEKLAE